MDNSVYLMVDDFLRNLLCSNITIKLEKDILAEGVLKKFTSYDNTRSLQIEFEIERTKNSTKSTIKKLKIPFPLQVYKQNAHDPITFKYDITKMFRVEERLRYNIPQNSQNKFLNKTLTILVNNK